MFADMKNQEKEQHKQTGEGIMNNRIMNVCGTDHPGRSQQHRHWQQWQM